MAIKVITSSTAGGSEAGNAKQLFWAVEGQLEGTSSAVAVVVGGDTEPSLRVIGECFKPWFHCFSSFARVIFVVIVSIAINMKRRRGMLAWNEKNSKNSMVINELPQVLQLDNSNKVTLAL